MRAGRVDDQHLRGKEFRHVRLKESCREEVGGRAAGTALGTSGQPGQALSPVDITNDVSKHRKTR